MLRLNIIGAGQVGQTLGFLLVQKLGFVLQNILNTSLESSQKAAVFIAGNPSAAVEDYTTLLPADLYLLTVPDQTLSKVVAELSKQKIPKDASVVHCSGALSSEILKPLQEKGAQIASVHPAQSFIDPQLSVEAFPGTHCAIEGENSACEKLKIWFEAIGARTFFIQPEQKLFYHTGLVLACNHLVSLTETALKTFEHIGLDSQNGLKILKPLMENTLKQIMLKGTQKALTGPVARGDIEIVAMQQKALLSVNERTAMLYQLLSEVAEGLVVER